MSVSGGSVTEATISSLMSSTTYSIQVAAVNSADTGVYSARVIVETSESKYIHINFHKVNVLCCTAIRHILYNIISLS